MIQLKQSVAAWVPVRLLDSVGDPVDGKAFGDVTAAVMDSANNETALTVTVNDWYEATTGAFAASGAYQLLLPDSATGAVGDLVYSVSVAGARVYVGVVEVVANLASDVYSRVGAPVGASISADIQNVPTDIWTFDLTTGSITDNYMVGANFMALEYGNIESATANTVVINAPNYAQDTGLLVGCRIAVGAGAWLRQYRIVESYVYDSPAPGKATLTVTEPFSFTPSGGDEYIVTPWGYGSPWNETLATHATADSMGEAVGKLLKHTEGRWKIHTSGPDANRLVVYDTDGLTALIKFDLKDDAGAPTTDSPYEREPV